MAAKRISRRQMLRGAGGVAVGLPFLPSLLPGPAWAQELPAAPRRFVSICTNHGGVDNSAMFPAQSTISEEMTVHPGHRVRRGDLVRTEADGVASVSEVLSAPSDLFTEQLLSKMNVFMGLDIPFYIGHHRGGHLGDYARNDGNGPDGQGIQGLHLPTIDQVLAYSSGFYGDDLAGVTARTVAIGISDNHSTGYSTPGDRSSNLVAQYTYRAAGDAFDFLFPNPVQQSDDENARPSIIDRVMDSYRSLRQSNRRLSREDRQRLDDHVARLQELDRRLNTTLSCTIDGRIGTSAGGETPQNLDDMLEVATLALICGATRIAVLSPLEYAYMGFEGNWHEDVAHQHFSPEPQRLLREANRNFFERWVLRLAQSLDTDMGDGTTLLDQSLVMWTQESGQVTHESVSMPLVTFGSAGGALRTGQFFDYRNLASGAAYDGQPTGLLYNQYLANVLLAMGVPESEWGDLSNLGDTGYGLGFVGDEFLAAHVNGVVAGASDWLPWLRA